jgi:isoquinoline 1-oxidoreductase beta subunit
VSTNTITRPNALDAGEIPTANPPVTKPTRLDRREFLSAAGGLILAFTLEVGSGRAARAAGGATAVDAYVLIAPDETITILFGGAEMGQGIMTGIAQIVAEELKADWTRVTTQFAPPALSWITGGSTGINSNYQAMRVAGAAAREMLIAAAAQTWGVSTSVCTAIKGTVLNTTTNASLTYGTLAPLAATFPVPTNPPLTDPSQFQIIGQSMPRLDIPAKTNGTAKYGIDITLPGMLFAVIQHCPSLGGTVSGKVPTPQGAVAVVPLGNAVAVVASNTWQAMQSAQELQVNWKIPSSAKNIDSGVFLTQAQQLMTSGAPVTAEQVGNVNGAFNSAANVVNATYSLPYLAHAYMEVLNCTVQVTKNSCQIWAPTQAPGWVQATAAAITGLPASQIQVNTTLLGGGLGRKIEQDYIAQAITVAQAIGKPVKLTWPREEDMSNDQYRPMALVNIQAALDANGNITGWKNRIVSPSIQYQRGWIGDGQLDASATDGATGLSYAFGSRLVEWVRHPAPVPVGFWRSVGHSINCFTVESAIDEVALATGVDPLALRQQLLANAPRSLAVLNAAAALGGWGTSLPSGHARGIAFSDGFGSLVAEVAEISQPTSGTIQVHNVACVIDCGSAINPDSVQAQMQGGVLHGLSAALWGQVTFKNGRASVRNWDHYRVLLLKEAPVVNVQIIQSGAAIGGVGEPGVPPIGPAVANAYARLTGNRVRTLPFFPGQGMHGGD